ncbi:hypothetical protein LSAT2_024347 [Lamellibrachia satsuma]|nr:hypothetical protein LSAT2_024347 [Lamellibrachia satsuma]
MPPKKPAKAPAKKPAAKAAAPEQKSVPLPVPIEVNLKQLNDLLMKDTENKVKDSGNKITTDGDSAKDAMARIRKASQTFAMLKPIWKSKQLRLETKLRLSSSNVLSVLLYGSECWKLTAKLAHKLEAFQNRCLRKILGVFWPNTIINEELHRKTRRWRWLVHVCQMLPGALPKTALRWTAAGKRRRTVEKELKECGLTWNTKRAADRQHWCSLVDALCATGHEDD